MHDVLKSFKQKPVPKISQKSSKFLKNIGFFSKLMEFCEIFGMDFVKMVLNHHALHHICIITMFHAF